MITNNSIINYPRRWFDCLCCDRILIHVNDLCKNESFLWIRYPNNLIHDYNCFDYNRGLLDLLISLLIASDSLDSSLDHWWRKWRKGLERKSRLKLQLDIIWSRGERKRDRKWVSEKERLKKRSWSGIHISGNWIKLSELTIFVTHTLYQIFERERVSLLMIHCHWMTREIWKYLWHKIDRQKWWETGRNDERERKKEIMKEIEDKKLRLMKEWRGWWSNKKWKLIVLRMQLIQFELYWMSFNCSSFRFLDQSNYFSSFSLEFLLGSFFFLSWIPSQIFFSFSVYRLPTSCRSGDDEEKKDGDWWRW